MRTESSNRIFANIGEQLTAGGAKPKESNMLITIRHPSGHISVEYRVAAGSAVSYFCQCGFGHNDLGSKRKKKTNIKISD
jgi:hypothetical protein